MAEFDREKRLKRIGEGLKRIGKSLKRIGADLVEGCGSSGCDGPEGSQGEEGALSGERGCLDEAEGRPRHREEEDQTWLQSCVSLGLAVLRVC